MGGANNREGIDVSLVSERRGSEGPDRETRLHGPSGDAEHTAARRAASVQPAGEQQVQVHRAQPNVVNQDMFQGFMLGLREFMEKWEVGSGQSAPQRAWADAGQSQPIGAGVRAREVVGLAQDVVTVAGGETVAPSVPADSSKEAASKTSEGGKKAEPISDAAKSQTYVCFEGPLGTHLKPEVRDKVQKGEYVDIFTLLPLERFNLDKWEKGKEHRKEEDEDRRRFRLIPRTFVNWLQAFCIFASLVGEKFPGCCSGLFCYLDSILEAHRVYGGVAWLRYDEQFRQRMSVRPSLKWDHKDIGLWLRLMNSSGAKAGQSGASSIYSSANATVQAPFHGGTAGQGQSGATVGPKKGFCFAFNEGQCKWGAGCKFRHECSGCGGAHPFTRCFKKGKFSGKSGDSKGEDHGERRRDATVAK
uniref:C3H1-type domain-containing protein n=1 Tax=Xenopus tropicalis TaxID=8364 RepID=A0A1B8XWI4_XENTR